MLSLTQEMKDHAGTNEVYCAEQRKQRIELKTVNDTNEDDTMRYDTIQYDTSTILSKVFSLPRYLIIRENALS